MKKVIYLLGVVFVSSMQTNFTMEENSYTNKQNKLENDFEELSLDLYPKKNKTYKGKSETSIYCKLNGQEIRLTMQIAEYSSSGDPRIIASEPKKVALSDLKKSDDLDTVTSFSKLKQQSSNKKNRPGLAVATSEGRIGFYRTSTNASPKNGAPILERTFSTKLIGPKKYEVQDAMQVRNLLFLQYKEKDETKVAVGLHTQTQTGRLVLRNTPEVEQATDLIPIPHAVHFKQLKVDDNKNRVTVTGHHKRITYSVKKHENNEAILKKLSSSAIAPRSSRLSLSATINKLRKKR